MCCALASGPAHRRPTHLPGLRAIREIGQLTEIDLALHRVPGRAGTCASCRTKPPAPQNARLVRTAPQPQPFADPRLSKSPSTPYQASK